MEANAACRSVEAPQTKKPGGVGMSRTKRIREAVRCFLESEGSANTVEVFDHLNSRFSWGATMNLVGNILAKDRRFAKIGNVRGFFRGARYSVCVWTLSSSVNTTSQRPVPAHA